MLVCAEVEMQLSDDLISFNCRYANTDSTRSNDTHLMPVIIVVERDIKSTESNDKRW